MFEQFKMRAEAVSAEVHRFPTKAETLDFIIQLLKKEGIADTPQLYAVWADCAFLKGVDKKQLSERVLGLKFEVSREAAADARIGITQMDWALANTGTLVQNSTAVEQRLASSLTFIHIAIIATDRLLSDLPALLTKIDPRESSYIAMVTGPSRTADIERVLTIGVHGPERLVIVFVDDLGGMN
jgi:L-lactate dehydrogenase complex protein LldG